MLGEPSPSLLAEQVGMGTPRDEMSVQHRVNLVLEPRAMPNQLRATSDLPTQRLGIRVRHPHRRQKAARVELREDARIDLVSLYSRVSDRTHLQRVGDHDLCDMRLQCPNDRGRITGCFQDHLIGTRESPAKRCKTLGREFHAASTSKHRLLKKYHFSKCPMYIESDDSHGWPPVLPVVYGSPWATRQLRIRARGATGRVARAAIY